MNSKWTMISVGCVLLALACGETGQTSEPSVGAPGGAASPDTGSVADPASSEDPGADPTGVPTTGEDPVEAGGTAGNGAAIVPVDPGASVGSYDYEAEVVALSAELVVPAGTTLRVGPGTRFEAQSAVAVRVEGTLVVEGTAESPVQFLGGGAPNSWHGIVVANGGVLLASHVEIGGATYGIHAQPGSDFTVDHADIGTSFKAAVIESDGSFDYAAFHASGNPIFSPVNEASIDDVNGTLTILSASPTVTNSTFDNSAPLVDMIRIGGSSSPVFDHIKVTSAHCAIHTFGDTNSHPTITNSVFEGLAYGFMAYTTAPVIENNVFLSNATDVGFCFGATTDSAPILRNNYYSAGSALVDPSCFQVNTADEGPASAPNPTAGPLPE